MPIALSVNLNKIALIRNSRDGNYPSVEQFGRLSLTAGAQGLTVHPRPDQRHIRPGDTLVLAELVKHASTPERQIEFNIEGNPFAAARGSYPGLVELALQAKPNQCTLVPDSDNQKTSDHGFDLKKSGSELEPLIKRLNDAGIRVSLFMDPDIEQIRLAKEVGADRIELYTGPYAEAFEKGNGEAVFSTHCEAAETAKQCGLGINAGHDLNLENLMLYRGLPGLVEVSIGHALTVDALLRGFETTVNQYLDACNAV